ncbi:Bifunctional UDP-sugar hydrolase 5'-nucleotidase periplasmic [Seminavis robusta]|uniref:Bifunctional UDP-sugar hydrolase 5'-nucleotidase periplasmic n=1 Tax=Seminavis robusta TaxID=568900 RepID=A0A9N8HJZ4_9STRA|nr:Bifunctional UDP-sugar hydrolase 5'-nucleotidase periplasmic [Seminavis robusta]|eukprot:Sro582_g170540.1 Bifunctional UDP-sugar hydrolase 5'-nucleotidase periplasmic (290) ;mRNA; f:40112-40981
MTARTSTRRSLLLGLFLCQYYARPSYSMKDCIEPLRMDRQQSKGPTHCSIDTAWAPQPICHNKPEDEEDCPPTDNGSNVCAYVIESLYADWRMLDGAFLTSGTCQASIRQGEFTSQDALRVLPANHELVAIRVTGRALKRALEQGLVDYYVHGNLDAYPHTAGLYYELDLLQPPGQRIQNLKLLGFSCNWKSFDNNDNDSILLLTDAHIADSHLFQGNVLATSKTGRGSAESFFLHATSVCTLKDNWHRMRLRHEPPTNMIPLDGLNQQRQQQNVQVDGGTKPTLAATI